MGIFDAVFKLFKPVEDFVFKYYDNDYLNYAVAIGFILFLVALGYLIFKFVASWFM